jgi:uncharacterized membrane protein (DUF106 family)
MKSLLGRLLAIVPMSLIPITSAWNWLSEPWYTVRTREFLRQGYRLQRYEWPLMAVLAVWYSLWILCSWTGSVIRTGKFDATWLDV